MSRLYPSSMKNMPENLNAPVYRPQSGPAGQEEKRRRRHVAEQLQVGSSIGHHTQHPGPAYLPTASHCRYAVVLQISNMLKEMWRCKLQQQCPVDSAGQISSWPPGQVSCQSLRGFMQHWKICSCSSVPQLTRNSDFSCRASHCDTVVMLAASWVLGVVASTQYLSMIPQCLLAV